MVSQIDARTAPHDRFIVLAALAAAAQGPAMSTPKPSQSLAGRRSVKTTKPKSVARLAALLGALLLSACAGTRAPSANEQTHVAAVEVVQKGRTPTSAFTVLLRETVLREAALYGHEGRPINLRIELTRVHFKNPLLALALSDDSVAKGQVAVIDPATGQQTSTFPVRVNADKGMSGASIAMFVVGTLDPTGFVDLGAMVANSMSATVNHSGTAAVMSANFAAETLRHTYGDVRAKAVANTRLAAAKAH